MIKKIASIFVFGKTYKMMNAKTETSSTKKLFMWYKLKELNSNGFNKSQISRELNIHRDMVRSYLQMSEEEFSDSSRDRRRW